jgi:hypothetical protein
MLKKICSFLLIFFLLSGNIFAYNSTKKDESYIDKITTKIYKIYLINPSKIDSLEKKISAYLNKKNIKISERNRYILFSISSYIYRLKMMMKNNDTTKADDSLSSLLNSIDKLKDND